MITAQHVLDLAHSRAADPGLVYYIDTEGLEVRSTLHLDDSARTVATPEDLRNIDPDWTTDDMDPDTAQLIADTLNQDDWSDTEGRDW